MQYKREQLFEAARRSRACTYPADDDHGTLAMQEILLAGCPVVGVRTGAPFIENVSTGVLVERLPPGGKCIANEPEQVALDAYMNSIHGAMEWDRQSVRAATAEEFGTERVVEQMDGALEAARAT